MQILEFESNFNNIYSSVASYTPHNCIRVLMYSQVYLQDINLTASHVTALFVFMSILLHLKLCFSVSFPIHEQVTSIKIKQANYIMFVQLGKLGKSDL